MDWCVFCVLPISRKPSALPLNRGVKKLETADLPRHLLIHSLVASQAEKLADDSVNLWDLLATQLVLTIGEAGFGSIYARSVFICHASYPWLNGGALSPYGKHRFAELKSSLQGQRPEDASAANRLLLITFTDILASLIGESLTERIVRLAWSPAAGVAKESENE